MKREKNALIKSNSLDLDFLPKNKMRMYQKGMEQINQILDYNGSSVEGLIFLTNFIKPIAEALIKSKMSISLSQVFGDKRGSSYNMNHPIFLLIHLLNDLILFVAKQMRESSLQHNDLAEQIQEVVRKNQQPSELRTQKVSNEEYEELIKFKL